MRVQVGIFTKALRGRLNDHVIDRNLGATNGVALGATAHEMSYVDIGLKIEMRHCLFAELQSVSDHLAHTREFDHGVAFTRRNGDGWMCLARSGGGSRRGGRRGIGYPGGDRRLDVTLHDGATGTASGQRRDINAVLFHHPARQRRRPWLAGWRRED